MNEKIKIGAFFDFDRTLIDVESGRIGFKYLYELGEIPLVFLLKILVTDFFYQRNFISDNQMARIMLKFYHKRRLHDFEDGSESFYTDYFKPHMESYIITKLREHQRAGHVPILI